MQSDTDFELERALEHREAMDVFKYLHENFTDNPKKMQKILLRMFNDTSIREGIRYGIIKDAYNAKNPSKWLRVKLDSAFAYQTVIKDLIANGDHGMLVNENGTIYPCSLKTMPQWLVKDKRWDIKQESHIAAELANNWMKDRNVGYFKGSVVLFQPYGFSGLPHDLELRCTADTTGLTRHEDSNLFYKE